MGILNLTFFEVRIMNPLEGDQGFPHAVMKSELQWIIENKVNHLLKLIRVLGQYLVLSRAF